MPNGIRWIPNEEIQQHAEEFLSQYWDDTLPVDVEYIAEYCLKISVLPLPGLKANIEGDGFITRDFKEIHLDFDQHEVRQRFTVAHELGHFVLHKEFIESLPATPDIQAWKTLYASLPEQQLNWMEYQAYEFAGCLLVPQHHLQHTFDVLLPEMDALSTQARQAGFRRHQYIDRLADWAAQRIARTFEVSPQVIDKRLHKTGLIADIP